MPTLLIHRLTIIIPAAKVATVVAWIQANINANAVDAQLGPPLNVSGLIADPVTHRWCCGSFNDAECKAILTKLCQLAGVTPLTNAQWNGSTQAQKIAWLRSVQAAIFANYGAWVSLADNTGAWDDPQGVLSALGVKTIAASL